MKKSTVQLGRLAGLALTAVLTLGASGAAQADQDDIFWSIAMSSPGVRVGVSNGPVLVHPAPVYMPPPRVVYLPPPPVYRVHPGYYSYGYGHDHYRGHWKHKRKHDDHDRRDRRDHYDRDHHRGHGGDGRGYRSGGEPMHMGRR